MQDVWADRKGGGNTCWAFKNHWTNKLREDPTDAKGREVYVTVQKSRFEAKCLSLYFNALAAVNHHIDDSTRVIPDPKKKALFDCEMEKA